MEEKDFLPPLFQREGVCLMRGRQGEEGEGERGEGGRPYAFQLGREGGERGEAKSAGARLAGGSLK